MKSRVHPKYKTKYRVGNWRKYERALDQRGWRKLHVGVDRSGVIVAEALTETTSDDATTGIDLIARVDGDRVSVTSDAADDTVGWHSDLGLKSSLLMDKSP